MEKTLGKTLRKYRKLTLIWLSSITALIGTILGIQSKSYTQPAGQQVDLKVYQPIPIPGTNEKVTEDGTRFLPDGTVIIPQGLRFTPDGNVYDQNGNLVQSPEQTVDEANE